MKYSASADKNSGLLREISVPLSARSAKNDPSCDTPIDCNTEANKTIVDRIEFRNIDGICNNLNNYTWGMTYVQHRRLLPDTYHNGIIIIMPELSLQYLIIFIFYIFFCTFSMYYI